MHNTFICLIVHLSTDVFTNKYLDMKEIYIYIAIEDFTSTLLGWDLLKSVFAYDIQGESVLNFKTGGQSTDPSACTKGQPIECSASAHGPGNPLGPSKPQGQPNFPSWANTDNELTHYLFCEKEKVILLRGSENMDRSVRLSQTNIKKDPYFLEKFIDFSQSTKLKYLDAFNKSINKPGFAEAKNPEKNMNMSSIYLTNDLLKAISVFENPNGRKSGGVGSPLDQFEIRNLLSLDAPIIANFQISLTNIRLYLTISAFIALFLNLLATNYNKVIANSWSISQESTYATIRSIVINQINGKSGQMYFPFIYALFIFILINNLIGMVPYSFASTSHFILTFFISFTVVLGATILGFQKHNLKFFSLFVPAGCPIGLLPLLVLIEFISYLARNVSLGLRLAANILSGHMLLNILSGFAYNIMTSGFIFFFIGLVPLAFIIAFSGLEVAIAFIQAQVFVVLTSSYIKDALDLH